MEGGMDAYLKGLEDHINQLQGVVQQQQAQIQQLGQPTPVSTAKAVFKPVRPDTFKGRQDRGSIEAWLFQLRQYFETVQVDPGSQVAFAASLLREDAAVW